jgi:hypothetical protein
MVFHLLKAIGSEFGLGKFVSIVSKENAKVCVVMERGIVRVAAGGSGVIRPAE